MTSHVVRGVLDLLADAVLEFRELADCASKTRYAEVSLQDLDDALMRSEGLAEAAKLLLQHGRTPGVQVAEEDQE